MSRAALPGRQILNIFGALRTQANFESAFWRSEMADNTTFEQWSSEGAVESHERARKRAVQMLESYAPPSLDESINDGLRDFINRRMEALPDTEF